MTPSRVAPPAQLSTAARRGSGLNWIFAILLAGLVVGALGYGIEHIYPMLFRV